MSLELPQSFYDAGERSRQSSAWVMWVAAAIALLTGWQLFDLPGTLVHVYKLPEDMPWFGHGIAGVTIDKDGSWTIRRNNYADRVGRYVISADGALVKVKDRGVPPHSNESGAIRASNIYMTHGHTLKVTASKGTTGLIKTQRESVLRSDSQKLPAAEQLLSPEATVSPAGDFVPTVRVMVYSPNREDERTILPGHHYYEMFDAACFSNPNLWLTTSRVSSLHRVTATDSGVDDPATDYDESVTIEVQRSVRLDLPTQEFDSELGFDPVSGRLYLVLVDGSRRWFDPQTLEQIDSDQLPGQWEREYAAIGAARTDGGYPAYTDDSGLALSESGYERMMALLVIVFLASVLTLALRWRLPWKFISEATTAA